MLDNLKANWRLWLAAAVLLVLLVMLACWYLWAPAPKKPEVYAPPVKVADGSVILEKKPDAQAKPKQQIPAGAKVERVVSVTVQPRTVAHAGVTPEMVQPVYRGKVGELLEALKFGNVSTAHRAQSAEDTPVIQCPECPPVKVDLSLIRMPDQTRRVIASSQDGEVVGGVDVPIEDAALPPAPKLWAAGAVLNPFKRTFGAFVDRDVAFMRLGLQLNQRNEGDIPNQVWLKFGVRW